MKVRNWRLPVLVAALLVVALAGGVNAQKKAVSASTPIKVDGTVIKGYIEYMASDDKEGRQSMTPGYEKVAEWAAGKFKEWGLKPAGDAGSFLQKVPVSGRGSSGASWRTGIPSLSVGGREFFIKDSDFTVDGSSTPGQAVSGEIVFVGYGISAPAKGLDEYAGVDVKGKVVLAFKGSPKDAPAARGMFGAVVAEPTNNEAWTDESRDAAKIKTAYEKGASAILLFSPEKLSPPNPMAQPQQMTPAQIAALMASAQGGAAASYTRPFIAVTDINERIFRHVMHRDAQESSRGFIARMEQWRRDIRDKKAHTMATGVPAKVKGYDSVTFFSEKLGNNFSHNVIGKVEGTDPKLKAQVIVVGGHLDHVGVSNGVVMNGADDNASGSATVMELARLMATNAATIKPKRTTYFALWCAEEMGLIGSQYWAKNPTDGVKMENVVATFNNDMVGLGDRIGAPGALNFPTIWDVMMKNQDPEVVKNIEISTSGPGGSDHSAFIEQGIQSLALMTAGGIGHRDYHDAGDDTTKIDPEMLRKNAQFELQAIINVATETTVPLLIPDRLHLYNGMRLNVLNLDTVRSGATTIVMTASGVIQQTAQPGPRFNVPLDIAALNGNTAMIDVAAKLMNVGRVVVYNPDNTWFSAAGITDRGKQALKAFESAGVVLQFHNPPAKLLADLLANAAKGFILSTYRGVPDAETAKKLVEKNVVVTVDFDMAEPQAVADRLIALKKALGTSGSIALTTQERVVTSPMGQAEQTPRQKALDAAKQKMYLALVKDGWTKDEIYSTVGVTAPPSGGASPAMMMGGGGLGGNLKKLTQ